MHALIGLRRGDGELLLRWRVVPVVGDGGGRMELQKAPTAPSRPAESATPNAGRLSPGPRRSAVDRRGSAPERSVTRTTRGGKIWGAATGGDELAAALGGSRRGCPGRPARRHRARYSLGTQKLQMVRHRRSRPLTSRCGASSSRATATGM